MLDIIDRYWTPIKYSLLILILLSGIVYLFNPVLQRAMIEKYTPEVSAMVIQDASQAQEDAIYDWSSVSETNLTNTISATFNSNLNQPIAIMTQPEAKVSTTVVAGVDDYSLSLAAGTLRQNQTLGEGNYALAGHHVPGSEWSLFSGVASHSEPGQKVYITDMDKVYEYTIMSVREVEATEVDIVAEDKYLKGEEGIEAGEPMITIFTCTSTGEARIAEFGQLSNIYEFDLDEVPEEAIAGFEKAANFDWTRE